MNADARRARADRRSTTAPTAKTGSAAATSPAIFLLSIPLAFLAPDVAPYLWLVLFFDPSSRLAAALSGRTVKATERPGWEQVTDQPRPVTTAWQR